MATPKRPFTEDNVRDMTDAELIATIGELDPEAEHDDLSEPDGELSHVWREAGNRLLLER